jgi:predicted GNAT family N-acyltransferase
MTAGPIHPEFRFVDRLSADQTVLLHSLYQREWWTKSRTVEQTQAIVANSSIVVGIVDSKDDLVAFARVLTDFIVKALILDVIVAEERRNERLGAALMHYLIEHPKLARVADFELYWRPEMGSFYRKWAFTSDIPHLQFMRRRLSS